MSEQLPRIVVVGSLNLDLIANVDRLPRPGQTVPASKLIRRLGGKGGNQAIAVARQGVAVSMIGALGDDDAGQEYRQHLRAEGIDDRGVTELVGELTGTAMIAVESTAENQIIVAPAANGRLDEAMVREQEDQVASASAVLVQWEVPLTAVIETLRLAAEHGVPLVMNPSPIHQGFPWGRYPIHTLIVNEHEAADIFGTAAAAPAGELREAIEGHRIERLVITRGGAPTIALDREGCREIPALRVTPVDTVGAGDSFAGVYAAAVAEGRGFEESIRRANVAGALATLAPGAQEAIPAVAQVENAVRRAGFTDTKAGVA